MTGSRRLTRRSALALVAAGGAVAGAETLGFTNVTGSRDVSLETAADPEALLGIDAADAVQVTWNDARDAAELTNNFGQAIDAIDARIEEIAGADEGVLTASADPEQVLQGGTSSVVVECDQREDVGERDVTFGVTATGESMAVDDARFVVSVDIQCDPAPGNGGGNSTGVGNGG